MEKYNILFVDDEPNIVRSLIRLFHTDPINVFQAQSGEEALQVFRSHRIQLLITDNKMPGMTGIELIKKVKDVSPDTIRIVLSGHSDMDAVLNAVNEGEAYRFILKPWHDYDLKATVNIALAHYKLAEDHRLLVKELQVKCRVLDYIRKHHPELFNDAVPGHLYAIGESDQAEKAPSSLQLEE